MLHIYTSNRLERLLDYLAVVCQQPLTSLLAPEIIIVPSVGIGRWLSFQLADKQGIVANVDFAMPANFIWQVAKRCWPNLPSVSVFSPAALQWKLWALFQSGATLPELATIRQYILNERGQVDANLCLELAEQLATLFNQYLVFRPQWLQAWEADSLQNLGEHEAWQAALWRELLASEASNVLLNQPKHRAEVMSELIVQLSPAILPERISLFGIATLPPAYVQFFQAVSSHCDVVFFTLNPCAVYWADQLKRLPKVDTDSGHPLLRHFGQQGREFFNLLLENPAFEANDSFVAALDEQRPANTLGILQDDILNLLPPSPCPRDDSIEIHRAHTPERELHILKNRLLALFNDNPTLNPADVAVLMPNLNDYAPLIDSVFGKSNDAANLPYSVADRANLSTSPLLVAFTRLLDLVNSRFEVDAVLALLECEALLAHFQLERADVAYLETWVQSAQIRWGRDAAHQASYASENSTTAQDPLGLNSWRWGLDRLLLGHLLPVELATFGGNVEPYAHEPLVAGYLPAGALRRDSLHILGRFITFYDTLCNWSLQWQHPASLSDWRERLTTTLTLFFSLSPSDTEDQGLSLIQSAITQMESIQQTVQLGATPIPFSVIKKSLTQALNQNSEAGFLTGRLTFCSMVPMRSLPFKVLCLIGLNEGALPRTDSPLSFDLMAAHPQLGDRSRRMDDRYLFLEALLSARVRLYFSYVGRDMRSNEVLPPSVLLSQTLDTLALMWGVTPESLVQDHPLQVFSANNYPNPINPKHAPNYDALHAEALKHVHRARQQATAPAVFFSEQIAKIATLSATVVANVVPFEDFKHFWCNGAPFWLRKLKISTLNQPADLNPLPPMNAPNLLDKIDLDQQILTNKAFGSASLLATGLLPPAAIGRHWAETEQQLLQHFAANLPDWTHTPALPNEAITLSFGDISLTHTWENLHPEGFAIVTLHELWDTEKIQYWLEHLLLCASRPKGVAPLTHLFYLCNKGVKIHALTLPELPAAEAKAELQRWVQHHQRGQTMPLPFFPKSSWAYASQFSTNQRKGLPDDQAHASALSAARAKWDKKQRNSAAQPEKHKFANRVIFRGRHPLQEADFAELAELLLPAVLAFASLPVASETESEA
jgi:exodeoxyribonuclease V gamma subunit